VKTSLKKRLWLGLFITLLAVLIIPYLAVVALMNSDNGDMLDRFEVVSSLPSPDTRNVAVVYRYNHADLSMEGLSVWRQSVEQPVESSDSGWPKGEPAFTIVNISQLPEFSWKANGRMEVLVGPSIIVRTTKDASDCFWHDGSEQAKPVLCLHQEWVSATRDGRAEAVKRNELESSHAQVSLPTRGIIYFDKYTP
jgi:hypothetical protein